MAGLFKKLGGKLGKDITKALEARKERRLRIVGGKGKTAKRKKTLMEVRESIKRQLLD